MDHHSEKFFFFKKLQTQNRLQINNNNVLLSCQEDAPSKRISDILEQIQTDKIFIYKNNMLFCGPVKKKFDKTTMPGMLKNL